MQDSTDFSYVYRTLDANFNRCQEGLRVLEEIARFSYNHSTLSACLKDLRHQLVHCFPEVWFSRFQSMRDVQGDVGRTTRSDDEYQRPDLDAVFNANASRIKQSLRTLEEFSKPLSEQVASKVEELRYEFYRWESLASLSRTAAARMDHAEIYVLTDGLASNGQFENWLKSLMVAPPDVIQLRDKKLNDRQLLERAQVLRRLTQGTQTLMVINDRPDIARLCNSDGVHVGQDELSVEAVRRIVGPDMLIGVSTHEVGQLREAILHGAQYLGAGPTFPSETKLFEDFPGLDYLREAAGFPDSPIFAIGGIDLENVDRVLETGIHRIAVSGCIARAKDPAEMVTQFRKKLGHGTSSPLSS